MDAIASTALLTADEERALARTIEAGILAAHLLASGERPVPATADELGALAGAGERARHHFLLANLRLARKLAGQEARRTGLPVDELFQEAVVALAGALQRFDPDRGRFSTFATVRVRQHLAEVAAARFGDLALPPSRALQLRRARGLAAVLGQERGGAVGPAELAAELGRPVAATRRLLGYRPPVALDEATCERGVPEPEPRDVDLAIWAAQFRRLLGCLEPDQAMVVELRYGFATGEPVHSAEVAARLGVSVRTVSRLERRALVALRPFATALDPRCDEPLAG